MTTTYQSHPGGAKPEGPFRRRKEDMMPLPNIEDTWAKLVTKYGLTAGIALFLVYFLTVDIKQELKGVTAATVANLAAIQALSASQSAHSRESVSLETALRSLVSVTVQNCVNNAPDRAKIDACFAAMSTAPQSVR